MFFLAFWQFGREVSLQAGSLKTPDPIMTEQLMFETRFVISLCLLDPHGSLDSRCRFNEPIDCQIPSIKHRDALCIMHV